jgi:hypothetical protein
MKQEITPKMILMMKRDSAPPLGLEMARYTNSQATVTMVLAVLSTRQYTINGYTGYPSLTRKK